MPVIQTDKNICAFLDTIAFSEGTSKLGDNGYNVLVGGTLFGIPPDCYAVHPGILVDLHRKINGVELESTCAGRYQLKSKYFPVYKQELHLPDFGPLSQDLIAIRQIRECEAYDIIIDGHFSVAVGKCAPIWASFPSAGYGQRENTLESLQAAYLAAGGLVE